MSIAANKVKGIRCALVHDVFSAKATREHNDSNILAMGERVIGPGHAREVVATWLNTPFEGGRHERRIDKMMELRKLKSGSGCINATSIRQAAKWRTLPHTVTTYNLSRPLELDTRRAGGKSGCFEFMEAST